jgi:outer membrane usher protein
MLTLNVLFDRGATGTLSSLVSADGAGAALDLSRSLPAEGGFGMRAQGRLGAQDRAAGRVEYQGAHGRIGSEFEWRDGNRSVLVEGSGALVAVDGRVFATRRIDLGYALVRVPGAAGVRVLLDNQTVGHTDERGDLLVPGLLPHYANRVSIDPADLPADFYASEIERAVAPVQRGAAVVRFQARLQQAVRGRLLVAARGAESVPQYGELRVEAGGARPVTSPIGSRGEFELEDLEPGQHRATILFDGTTCRFNLRVPDTEGLVDVGSIKCQMD